MTTYKLMAVGTFYGASGPEVIEIPGFDGATAAGFYTTRIVEADDGQRAIELAANSIDEELKANLGKRKGRYKLEFETCEQIAADEYDGPRRGFTFFAEE